MTKMPAVAEPPKKGRPKKVLPKGRHPMARLKYGVWWHPVTDVAGNAVCPKSDGLIELRCLQVANSAKKPSGHLGFEEHFKRFVTAVWSRPDVPKHRKWEWNPNAARMLREAIKHPYLAIAGHKSSSKSQFGAMWAIVKFLIRPADTLCILTSVTLEQARKRIWGVVEEYWQDACGYFGEEYLPGQLVSARGLIRYRNPVTGEKSDRRGLTLIPGDPSQASMSIRKLQGLKAPVLIVVADELSELSDSVVQAMDDNLDANDSPQLIGISNPNSPYDPFGRLCEPKAGWHSINAGSDEWETTRGYAIRFDGEKSPNVVAGEELWNGLLTLEKLEAHAEREGGRNSSGYWRMVRAFFPPTGTKDAIYNTWDIINYRCDQREVKWRFPAVKVASCDPAFKQNGDRAVVTLGLLGTDMDGKKVLCVDGQIVVRSSTEVEEGRDEQIADEVIRICKEKGIKPENFAYDDTGAGVSWGTLVKTRWSRNILSVRFGGAASELPVSSSDRRKCKEKYDNRVTELWYSGQEYVRTGQLKGLTPDITREMTARNYSTTKFGKIVVEPKHEMKLRGAGSPDLADSLFILLHLCRERLGFGSIERAADAKPYRPRDGWESPRSSPHEKKSHALKHRRLQYDRPPARVKWSA